MPGIVLQLLWDIFHLYKNIACLNIFYSQNHKTSQIKFIAIGKSMIRFIFIKHIITLAPIYAWRFLLSIFESFVCGWHWFHFLMSNLVTSGLCIASLVSNKFLLLVCYVELTGPRRRLSSGLYNFKLSPGPRLNIKTVLSTYGDFHVKDKTAVRTSYL